MGSLSYIKSCLLLALIGAGIAPAADDWPMYLRDHGHSSFNAAEAVLNKDTAGRLERVWSTNLYSPMAASAVVVDGVVYVGEWGGHFYAMDAATGKLKWWNWVGVAPDPVENYCPIPGLGVSGSAAVKDNVVYVPGGDSAIYALDKNTGEQIWRLPLADPDSGAYLWASLVIYDNALYAGVASLGDCPLVRGAVVRIDLDEPDRPLFKWLAPADEIGGGSWLTPAFDKARNMLYLTTGTGNQDVETGLWGGSMLAMDATTLEVKAHYFLPTNSLENDIEWGSSMMLFETSRGDPMVAAAGKDGILYAQHRGDLSEAWSVQIAIGCICPECGCGSLSTPAFDGRRLYVGAGASAEGDTEGGSVYAIGPDDGRILWRRLLNGTVIAPVTVAGGLVFVATMTGLEIFEADTGQQVWWGPPDLLYSQPVVADGAVYTTQMDGRVICWRPGTASGQRLPRADRETPAEQ